MLDSSFRMSWIDKIINKAIGIPHKEGNVTTFTFRGEATTDPYEISELNIGWQWGFDFTVANYTVATGYKVPWPEGWGKGFRGNGFAEGTRSGMSFIIDRDYPKKKKSISWDSERNCIIEYADGSAEIVKHIPPQNELDK